MGIKPITMQKEIIAAIAEYLYHFTESTDKLKKVRFLKAVRHDKTREDFLQEIAAEIAAAIVPLVKAGGVDDSQYTDDFLKWREKYFDRKTQIKHFRSKLNGNYFSNAQLESNYERAYNCNSKK